MVDRDFYNNLLYPLQDDVLRVLSVLKTNFYLTGGTALARGYLGHRFSDDLDFFVDDDERFGLWAERFVVALTENVSWRTVVLQRDSRFVRLSVTRDTVVLKIDLVNDVPAHVGEIRQHSVLGRLDSPENVLANKVTALIDREEPKDLADIWGLCMRAGLSLELALDGAQAKAAGVFPADLARILCSATEADWALVRWDAGPSVSQFVDDLRALGERLLGVT